MSDQNIKKHVREFYDRVGWQSVGDMLYQNAQYEDLRPVSQEYLQRCHMRVKKHLAPKGGYLLDAGSGPVQYPEYLTYSEGYRGRVCMDISFVALKEARKRLGEHGLYVVADIARLPFKADSFDGIVSLHTIHHVPVDEKLSAYEALHRTLRPGRSMVIVNGWTNAPLMERSAWFMRLMKRLRARSMRGKKRDVQDAGMGQKVSMPESEGSLQDSSTPAGTFVQKLNANWLESTLSGRMEFEIRVWRSVSVPFLRSVIYPDWGGRFWLRVLFWFEERFPRLLGRIGQYPMVIIRKPTRNGDTEPGSSAV